MKKIEEASQNMLSSSPPSSTKNSLNPKLRLNLMAINGSAPPQKKAKEAEDLTRSRKSLDGIIIPDLNEKFISNLANQLDSLFGSAPDDEV